MLKDKEITENLNERFQTAYNNGSRFFNQLLDAVRYGAPTADGLNILYQYDDSGKNLEYYVNNDTPQIAADKRASQLHSLLLPVGRRWGEIYTNGTYNDDLSEEVYKIMQRSNIHSIAHNIFLDLCIGCAGIWIDSYSKKQPLVFKPITGVAILPEYNDSGNPENVWFRRSISDLQLKEYSRSGNASSDNKNYVTCGFIKNRLDDKPIYAIKNADKYEWLYIEILNDEWTAPLLLEAKRFKQLHVINDTMRAGEARGRGIILKMLNDIVYLNDLTADKKEQVKLKGKPPLLADPNLGNKVFANLSGGILPSTLAQDGVPLLQPMQWDIDVPTVRQLETDLENKINLAFNVMPFGNIEQTPVRTATEIAARDADAQRQSTTDISKMIYDFDQIFGTCLEILKTWGTIPSGNHEIKFINPTLLAENQAQLNNLITYKQVMAQMVDPNFPTMMTNAAMVDQYVKGKLNIPPKLNNSAQQIQEAKDKIDEMVNQNPQLAQATQQPSAVDPSQLGMGQQVRQRGFGV